MGIFRDHENAENNLAVSGMKMPVNGWDSGTVAFNSVPECCPKNQNAKPQVKTLF